jgi:hypothetical protein
MSSTISIPNCNRSLVQSYKDHVMGGSVSNRADIFSPLHCIQISSSVKATNSWSLPPYFFVVRYVIKYSDNLHIKWQKYAKNTGSIKKHLP